MPSIKATGIPQLDALIAEARHDAYKAVKEATKILADDYKKAVHDFYGSYSPTSYIRTFSTYTATDSYKGYPAVRFVGDNMFEGGIKVGPEFIPGDPYKQHIFKGFMSKSHWSKELIFSGVFGVGSHGGVAYSTPPAKMMRDSFERAKAHVEKTFFSKYA